MIAVNQDKLGRQGFRVRNDSELGLQVWKRELHDGVAVLLHNSGEQARDISFELSEVGFDADTRVVVRDLYAGETLGSAFLGVSLFQSMPMLTGVGLSRCVLFCRDHLSPRRDNGVLCGLYTQLRLGIARY